MVSFSLANGGTDVKISRGVVAVTTALLLLLAGIANAQSLPHNIPDFSNDPTRSTVRSATTGNWSSGSTWVGGAVPTANQVVHVDPGHVVTVDNQSAVAYTIAVHGRLRFNPAVNTRLTATTLMVMGDHGMPTMSTVGHLEVGTTAAPIAAGVTAEIVIRNSATGSGVADPEQFGTGLINMGKVTMHGAQKTPTWLRVGAEPLAGHTTLTLEAPVTGWAVGDRLVLPDTRHIRYDEVSGGGWTNSQNQWEERTISAISTDRRVLTLNAALTYNHRGSRNFDNVLEYLPHVGNLTRNVVVRSESATGTRGHTIAVHNSDTDIRYVTFRDLGRTTYRPLNTTTNLIGRYPIHMHHNRGPLPTPANGYQFTLLGNAVDGGSATTQFKWGIAIHNSHYGLIQDNVVYNYNGSSIVTEDGSESFNVFDHNFALRGMGEPDNSVSAARAAMGTEGVGLWFRGANNYVRNNVAANFQNETTEAAYGFVYQLRLLGNVGIPNFKGADPAVSGQFTTRNGNNMPILQFENNETYGATQGGFTYWWIGGQDPVPYSNAQESVIRDLRIWNTYNKAVYVYPGSRVTFDGLKIRGEYSSNARCCGNAVHFNDYSASEIIIRNSDIQGMNAGIDAPAGGFGSPKPNLTVENTIMRNWVNINVPTPSSVNGCWMQDKLIVARNVTFLAPPGRSLQAIDMDGAVSGTIECLNKLDEVRVYRPNGDASVNFQLYHPSTSVLPRPSCSSTTRAGFDGPTCSIAGEGGTPPTVTLSASPASIPAGQSSTLSWTSSNATTVSINQGIGTVATSGTRSVSPASTTTYTITATGPSGSITATATVTVAQTPTVTFGAFPATISTGQASTLSWTTSNATAVSINQGIGTVGTSGTRSVSPTATTTYTITATGAGGTTTATATVTLASTPTISFNGAPMTVTAGQPSTLSWTTTNATSVSINQGIGSVGTSGSMAVSPSAQTTYTLTATGPGGTLTRNLTVEVLTSQADVLWRHSSGANYVWQLNGTEKIGEGPLATVDTSWQVAGTADYNGDGHADVLWRHNTGANYLWLLNGTARIGEGHLAPVDPSWQTVGAGDYNGDGNADILWRHSSGANYLWLMDGTTRLGEGHLAPVDPSWQLVDAGDYNGDSRADILWRHGASGNNYMWLMNGTTRTGEGYIPSVDPAWQLAAAGDYNGDGRTDIVWRHTAGTNYMWLMNGTTRIGEGHIPSVVPAWQVVGAGDYNGDGNADLLWRHSSGTPYMWFMDGTTRIGEGPLAMVDPAWQLVYPR